MLKELLVGILEELKDISAREWCAALIISTLGVLALLALRAVQMGGMG